MNNLVKIYCENNSSELFVKPGTTLLDVLDILNLKNKIPYIAAYVDNKSKDLNYIIYEPRTIKFIDQTHFEGYRIYGRTLFFVLYKAVCDLYEDATLKIKHSIGSGYYFEIENAETTSETPRLIKERMDRLVEQDLTILRDRYRQEEMIEIYSKNNLYDKIAIIETHQCLYYTVNMLADKYGYFYGTLAPSSSYVKVFDVKSLDKGFYLCLPKRYNPDQLDKVTKQDKLLTVFKQHKKWNEIIKISTLGDLNRRIIAGDANELIQIGEALQSNMFYEVANTIFSRIDKGLKLILIAGPSSSGKTTSSKRLNIQLRVFGLKPTVIAMDDYFVNRDQSPVDDKGNKNYETLQSVDTNLFNEHLNKLINGESVEMPKYDFLKGERYYDGTFLKLDENSVLIVEGIHALNPELTKNIESNHKFKLYVSALTSLSMDNLSRISTTDNRLIRRIVRDNAYRGHSARETLERWGSVRKGEEENIFPYQEEADYMINTALYYEICVLKRYAEPLLLRVSNTTSVYSEACRLLKILDHFQPIDDTNIPQTSILREFIGGSSFDV